MTINVAHWSVDRATGNIRYIGDDHIRFGGSTPSYATVIELHRWLQDLADDASFAGNDELDITDDTPSERATDNYVTLINGYNIDDTAAEHLYDGSIVQSGGAEIYDGIVNFGNSTVTIQIVQNGVVLADDWWNVTGGGGLNASAAAGISHRFMLKTRTASADVDGRRVIGTSRTFGKTYSEFKINGTSRGNNVLALADSTDLNNATVEATVSTWSDVILTEGYIHIDVNNDSTADEYFYVSADKGSRSINQFYERVKWLTRDGSASTIFGLNGELFRGITHQIPYTGLTGTFDEGNAISWTGTNTGTGQVLADDGSGNVWIQLLTGVAPANGDALTQSSPDAASATAGTVLERPLSYPVCGASTGSALIGAYGFGVEYADLSAADIMTALDTNPYYPPNNVTFSVSGLVTDEDYILVGPASAGVLNTAQFTLNGALTGAAVTAVVVNGAIPVDTPSAGFIRITRANGLISKHAYTSWAGSTFTIGSTSFATNNAANGAGVFVGYLDQLADSTPIAASSLVDGEEYIITTQGSTVWTSFGAAANTVGTIFTMSGGPGTGTGFAKPRSTTASFTVVYASPRNLFVRARDGGTVGDSAGIKTFETTGVLGSGGGSTTVIRTPDV